MTEPITFRIPLEGEILIKEDGNVPFTVIGIQNGNIQGITPDGTEILCPIESEPHILDQFDL